MDEVTRILLDSNRKLRRGMEAIRDGHEAGIAFLKDAGEPVAAGIPKSLIESVALAERVARAALGPPGEYELQNTVLRRMLLAYGAHTSMCHGDDDCICTWGSLKARLLKDTVPVSREDAGLENVP